MKLNSGLSYHVFCAIILMTSFPVNAALENYLEITLENGIKVYPSVELSLSYDDNIFQEEDTIIITEDGRSYDPVKSSVIYTLKPELVFSGTKSGHSWQFGYHGDYGVYQDSSNDDYIEHSLSSEIKLQANYRNRLDLNLKVSLLHEPRGTGISDDNDFILSDEKANKYRDTEAYLTHTHGGKNAIGNIEFQAGILDRSYLNNKEITSRYDRQDPLFRLTFSYRLSPITSLIVLGQYKKISYDEAIYDELGTLDSSEQRYEAGFRWKPSAKTEILGTLGLTDKNFESSLRKDISLTSWELSGNWSPKTYSKLTFSLNSEPTETTGEASFIKRNRVELEWDHKWTHKTSSLIRTVYRKENYQGISRDDKIWQQQIGINYLFRKGIRFGLSFNYNRRNSTEDTYDYTNNIWMLTSQIGL